MTVLVDGIPGEAGLLLFLTSFTALHRPNDGKFVGLTYLSPVSVSVVPRGLRSSLSGLNSSLLLLSSADGALLVIFRLPPEWCSSWFSFLFNKFLEVY